MDSFHQLLISAANKAGFPLAGALDIDLALPNLSPHVDQYDQWLEKGYAGKMQWLSRGRDRRTDPRQVFPEAESILCVAVPYSPRSTNPSPSVGPKYARYLAGKDYHEEIAEKLEGAMQALEVPNLKWKVCVDTSAILERSWAALAGLGWIGKNTLLINPQQGSYLFLAEVLINQKVGRGPAPLPDFCGNCNRCLDSCPTQAFPMPHVLNANECISYLTLEKRGEHDASAELQKKMGAWVAGCDICQEVCPFNTKPTRGATEPTELGALAGQSWEYLIEESPEQYKVRVKESSLSRVKPADFSRNLAIALFNTYEESSQQEQTELKSRLSVMVTERVLREPDQVARANWKMTLDCFTKTKTQ